MGNVKEVSSREARQQWRDILDTVMTTDSDVAVTRYGKRVAVIIPADDYEAVAEQLEDTRLSRLAESIYSDYLENQETAMSYEDIRAELLDQD